LGFGNTDLIKKHDWFRNINWKEVSNLELEPPIKPDVKNKFDIGNFEDGDDKPEIEGLKDMD